MTGAVGLTGAAAAGRHLEHVAYRDAAEDRPVRRLERVVREVPARRPSPRHVDVVDDHHRHADRADGQGYRQGHLPGLPRRASATCCCSPVQNRQTFISRNWAWLAALRSQAEDPGFAGTRNAMGGRAARMGMIGVCSRWSRLRIDGRIEYFFEL